MRVSELQKGNILITHIKRVSIEYKYTVFDYEPGEYFGVLHITLHLHINSPQYIFNRIERIKDTKSTRVPIILLLINQDITTLSTSSVFTKLQIDCMSLNIRIIPAYTPVECAKYIENMHLYKNELVHLRNYQRTLNQAKRELSDKLSTDESIRKLLFIRSIPKITKSDGIILLSTRTISGVLNDSIMYKLSHEKGIGKLKESSVRDFFMQKFN
ncbi:DNA excision repair protein ERCC-1 [Nematocida sp. ERTm5]|nr:DNA excision repair protein ERCC-1 [Nematocida sp. ERTm5]